MLIMSIRIIICDPFISRIREFNDDFTVKAFYYLGGMRNNQRAVKMCSVRRLASQPNHFGLFKCHNTGGAADHVKNDQDGLIFDLCQSNEWSSWKLWTAIAMCHTNTVKFFFFKIGLAVFAPRGGEINIAYDWCDLFILGLAPRSNAATNLDAKYVKLHGLAQGRPFWGLEYIV